MRKGRFTKELTREMSRFNSSLPYDRLLFEDDIAGSVVHARALRRMGILSEKEEKEIVKALETVRGEIRDGKFAFREELEDVHMNIEARCTEITPSAKKLHTARSRNDQVNLAMRLFLRRNLISLMGLLLDLIETLSKKSEEYGKALVPSYTHLQRAQIISAGMYLNSFAVMFMRDFDRFFDSFKRVNVMTLSSGTGAGVNYLYPAEFAKEMLALDEVRVNSLDAVSDRDFIAEFLSNAAMTAVHFSRLAEDLCIWSSEEFSFAVIAEEYSSGSSIMPHKKNPDAAELLRGKSGFFIGNLVSLLTVLKGLPLSYNKDLQEDKKPLVESVEALALSLEVLKGMIATTRFDREKMRKACEDWRLAGVDVVDRMVMEGIPLRVAHERAGAAVREGMERGVIPEIFRESAGANAGKRIAAAYNKKKFNVELAKRKRSWKRLQEKTRLKGF
ncbi:MAG: argininosuccinate lyase [Deltaproteobacteria bacterium]|nr:argininosuccinate lyase [Deltaproteobacteria bacterium]